jgi:hypothetical protein
MARSVVNLSIAVALLLAACAPEPDAGSSRDTALATEDRLLALEAAGNVLFARPAGWMRQDNSDGTVLLVPPGLSEGQRASVLILQGGELGGAEFRRWFEGAWLSLLQANEATVIAGGEVTTRRADDLDIASTSAVTESARFGRIYLVFFAAASSGRSEALIFTADPEDVYKRHLAAVSGLFASVRFADARPAATLAAENTRAPASTQATTAAPGALQVESMYVGFATDYVGVSPELATQRQHRFNFLVFYTNGLVYRGGAANFAFGPAALDLANDAVRRFNLGTYRIAGDQIQIAWSGEYTGATDVIQRQGDRLSIRGTAGTPWERLAKLDGLRTQGMYVPASGTVSPNWITFGADGTFKEQGVIARVHLSYFLERGLTAPEGGTGTYAFHDHTLTLRYNDGREITVLAYVLPGDDLRRPKRILLATYFYELAD